LQFAACDFQGFEKKILVLAARDSSTLALAADTGNMLSNRAVQPKKPFKALFMQTIGTLYCFYRIKFYARSLRQ